MSTAPRHLLAPRRQLAMLALAAPAAFAQSTLPPGVGVYLDNAVVGMGNASYASSNSVSIYSAGGLDVSSPPASSGITYALTSANSMPLGLTTATLSSIGSNVGAGGHATGTATATADLAGGVVRGTAGSSADIPYQAVGPVAARVITTSAMQDYLTFSTGAAGADVAVTVHLDGSFALNDPIYGGASNSLVIDLSGHTSGGGFVYYFGGNSNGNFGYTGQGTGQGLGGFTSYSITNETASGFDFNGILHVTDGERVKTFMRLYLDCSYSSCDFGNTARFSLTLPEGVTYASDSGVFLSDNQPTAAVPEPGTWALMLGGFVAIGGLTRRRALASGTRRAEA